MCACVCVCGVGRGGGGGRGGSELLQIISARDVWILITVSE